MLDISCQEIFVIIYIITFSALPFCPGAVKQNVVSARPIPRIPYLERLTSLTRDDLFPQDRFYLPAHVALFFPWQFRRLSLIWEVRGIERIELSQKFFGPFTGPPYPASFAGQVDHVVIGHYWLAKCSSCWSSTFHHKHHQHLLRQNNFQHHNTNRILSHIQILQLSTLLFFVLLS